MHLDLSRERYTPGGIVGDATREAPMDVILRMDARVRA